MNWQGIIAAHRARLPLGDDVKAITLLEGNTPLVEAQRLAESVGFSGELYLKIEGMNPTGSFKDRGMTVAVSQAVAEGSQAVICASTGNTSASAAAYAARAGIKSIVVIPQGKIALGKLSQAVMHGATVLAIEGNFDRALDLVSELAEEGNLTLVNSVNPFRIEGQKTAAFEVCNSLGRSPTHHLLPVGNAGNITAYWKGYREYREAGVIDSLPVMGGFQAEGAAPLVSGEPVENPETIATAIRIGRPASWTGATAARDESGGFIESVSDKEILEAQRLTATKAGVFVEPASAASIAGLKKLADAKRLPPNAIIVCTLTGHGLKDPETATNACPKPVTVPATIDAIREVIER